MTTADEDGTPAATSDPGEPKPSPPGRTRSGSTYAFLVIGAIVTVALLVFIIQNLDSSPRVAFFGLGWELPIGINMLLAALAGAIVTGLVGAVRILQLRRAYRRR